MTPEKPSPQRPSGGKLTEFTIIFEEGKAPIGPIPCLPTRLSSRPSGGDPTGDITIVLGEDEQDPDSGQPKNPLPPSP
jgi:hypothetical protein